MMFRTLNNVNVKSKRVLLRVDLNVPINQGQVLDTTRIHRVKPTIEELSRKGAKVILLTHFGRPKGKVTNQYSLRGILQIIQKILGFPIFFLENCIGEEVERHVRSMNNGDILLLENTRFHIGEEKNDLAFSQALSINGDIYVNDAFSVSHRAHASTEGVAHLLPAYAGRLMQAELEALEKGLSNPKKPVAAMVGGSKISTKIDLLKNLLKKVDILIIGGGMANTFLAAKNFNVGQSLCEHELTETVHTIIAQAQKDNCELILPSDAVVGYSFEAQTPNKQYSIKTIPQDGIILDIGESSIQRFSSALRKVATLIWNGPLGAFELPPFDTGTLIIAKHIAEQTKTGNLISIAGGGDTIAAINKNGLAKDFTYISTAGGAFLKWMEGKVLPGVSVLKHEK
ncbi:MAG: phosphoglycerate kinase [Candidatus Tokpelaia sp. JSC161]|nr:MAG: phosphoglycerate kinase [Candidatus Tokpelaia sp. JSC161]